MISLSQCKGGGDSIDQFTAPLIISPSPSKVVSKVSEPYDKPFLGFSNSGNKERILIPKIVCSNGHKHFARINY